MALSRINTNQIVDGAVATADIADGLITTAKLADGAVTTAKITDGNISTAKLADDAVTNAKVADDAINTAQIADNAVANAQMADNAVGTSEIADDAVTTAKVNPSQTDITSTGTLTSLNVSGDVSLDGGNFVFNESSADKNFRIESNGISNMFVVDGGNDNVGIGVSPESAVKLEVNAGSDGAVGISCRSDGGNGNNRRFNIIPYASGGTYGGGLKIETRNNSNVFSEIFEYNAYQQEIFKGNYRTADAQTYSDKKHFYALSENLDWTTTSNGVAQTLTASTTLPYQMGTPFFVRAYYNSDSALMTTVYGIFDIGYHNHKVQTLMTHDGTGTIDSLTVGSTGAYNSAKLTVTLDPQASYPANNFSGTIYYGYGVN